MYVLFGAQKKRLNETVLLSTHNICFGSEKKYMYREQSDLELLCLRLVSFFDNLVLASKELIKTESNLGLKTLDFPNTF